MNKITTQEYEAAKSVVIGCGATIGILAQSKAINEVRLREREMLLKQNDVGKVFYDDTRKKPESNHPFKKYMK